MIPKIMPSASTIYSTLGNNSSLVPLAIKDIANSCGLTAASYMSGDNVEGKDRLIDEFGTQAIWLWGIPAYQKLFNLSLYKPAGLDSKIDARILKNKDILQSAIDLAPTDAIKNNLIKASKNQKLFKNLTVAKFIASTAMTCLTYFGLTKFRHKYTENQIKKDYFEKQNNQKKNSKNANPTTFSSTYSPAFSNVHSPKNPSQKGNSPSFTGGIQDFIFDPVKNLMLVDGSITTERLTHSRNPQDLFGYLIKEGSFWLFMYGAGPLISKALEKNAEKNHNKSIDLDARVLESKELENAFKNGTLKSHIEEFKKADLSDVDIYKFAVSNANKTETGSKNLVIEMASMSDIINFDKTSKKVDTRQFIDLAELRGVSNKLEKLLGQFENSGETLDTFLTAVKKLKRQSVLKNIGSCIGALGIIAPAIMLLVRKLNPEYQVKKDIEEKIALQSEKKISK